MFNQQSCSKMQIDLRESFTLKSEQLIVRLTPPKAGEEEDEISMFTKNQSFVANSQNKYFLENVIHFLPRVVYWFRPNYAVQIAAHFTVKMLSGEKDSQTISKIISANRGLGKYFENLSYVKGYMQEIG